jgi:amino acid transporter/mannitol/fructose-specific phosphotransferase system IIA component (Ntr-type)
MIYAYLLAGFFVVPAMLAKAELATAMPKSGGIYFFVDRSMGVAPGTMAGLGSWFSLSFKSAFALIGIGAFAVLINPAVTEMQIKIIAVLFCLIFMVINLLGVRLAGSFQIGMDIFLIATLVLYIAGGSTSVQNARYMPFAPFGYGAVISTAGLVFVSFGGLTKIAAIAEEIKNPGRNIPLAMFLAFVIVLALYVFATFVTIGLVDAGQLKNSLTPISLGAYAFMGTLGAIIMALAAMLAFVSTANAGLMSASRNPMAMSRDGLLPKNFEKVNEKFGTPHFSIIITSVFMIIIILFLGIENLVKTASAIKILLFLSVNLSLIVMRESKIANYQPKFHAPLYPWLQILGIAGYVFLIIMMGSVTLLVTAAFIGCALLWYLAYVRPRIRRESALMYVVERITDRQIVDDTLRDELREVVKEREEIIEDEFDHLVKDALILDFEDEMSFDGFVKIAADELSKRHNVPPKKFIQLFIEREKQSCTALRPGLAIPHIIIDGKNEFDVLLVRSKQGIIFPDAPEPVHIVFVLVGTRDMRHSHLRALMAIAQIAQQSDFDEKWLNAATTKDLRDIMLLGDRKRH